MSSNNGNLQILNSENKGFVFCPTSSGDNRQGTLRYNSNTNSELIFDDTNNMIKYKGYELANKKDLTNVLRDEENWLAAGAGRVGANSTNVRSAQVLIYNDKHVGYINNGARIIIQINALRVGSDSGRNEHKSPSTITNYLTVKHSDGFIYKNFGLINGMNLARIAGFGGIFNAEISNNNLILSTVGDGDQRSYYQTKNLYYSQISKIEIEDFDHINKHILSIFDHYTWYDDQIEKDKIYVLVDDIVYILNVNDKQYFQYLNIENYNCLSLIAYYKTIYPKIENYLHNLIESFVKISSPETVWEVSNIIFESDEYNKEYNKEYNN